jgi:myo-inositol-1-phosphate synthase
VSTHQNVTIAPADGRLGVLIPGMGAVTSTFIAGVEAVKQGLGEPIGSLTQLGTIRLGKRTEARTPRIKDFVPLAPLQCLSFGTWDIYEDNAYEAAVNAKVLDGPLMERLKDPLSQIKPMKAVFDQYYVKRINGPNVKSGSSKMELAEAVMEDIREFKRRNGCTRLVMIWCGSTEVFHKAGPVHQSLSLFEEGLRKNDPEIAPSQIYAYAALKLGVPFANGAPNLTTDVPAMLELSRENQVPICGKDFKTGQTYMKTLLAPGFKARMLGVRGWFSTNIQVIATEKCSRTPAHSRRKRRQSFQFWSRFSSPISILSFTKISITQFGSITILLVETRRRGGITSTSSDGSGTQCRSRSIFSAVIRS